MTKQEMFNKAFLGLKSQGFERAATEKDGCMYAVRDDAGKVVKRCAWGWVDPVATEHVSAGAIWTLRRLGVGLAAELDGFQDEYLAVPGSDFDFADQLQKEHDHAVWPAGVEQGLRNLAARFGLTVPA
jgi:hypothetical protein